MPSAKTTLAILALVVQAARGWPQPPLRARILERQAEIQDEYDYVIVGGGTSGLTVGDRLTESGEHSVLVIETGKYHTQTGMHPSRMFDITSQPSPELNNRTFFVGLGKAVGGSSAVNGQLQIRGTREEYNAWKELGGPDSTWDWDGLLPYFRKGINLVPPIPEVAEEFLVYHESEFWGNESSIYARYGPQKPAEVTKDLYAAMAAMPGVNIPQDSGSGENGLYWYPVSVDPNTGLRSYARTGHWDNVPRDNYELIVDTKATRVLLDENLAATGVEFTSSTPNGAAPVYQTVSARKEVIIAAGTMHTPQVLMLSGIGPKTVLDTANIDVKVELPGVGANFQDHSYIPTIGYQWGIRPNNSGPGGGLLNSPNLAAMLGLPVVSPENFEALAAKYEQQDPTTHLPSTYTDEQIEGYRQQQAVYARLMRSPATSFNMMMLMGPGGSIQNLHCLSRGTVTLNSENPEGEVIVDYRGGSNEIDLDIMAENILFVRRWMAREELAKYEPYETFPGNSYTTAEQLVEWSRGQIIPSVYHPVGTCAKMPRELGGCVDEDLLVYGTTKLSVIDASLMPTIVGGNTQMTVYAVAEKVSSFPVPGRIFIADM